MTVYRFYDHARQRDVEIDGELITSVDSRDLLRPDAEDRPRWNQLELYWLPDSGQWLLHRWGESVIYHREDTGCTIASGQQRGSPCTAADMPPDAEPCVHCRPPARDKLPGQAPVRYEFPRHAFHRCATAPDVLGKLADRTERDRGPGVRTSDLSRPGEALRDQAVAASPRFRDELLGQEAERIA